MNYVICDAFCYVTPEKKSIKIQIKIIKRLSL